MIRLLIKYLLIFMIGAIAGWILEVFYRRYFGKARKWINPGFLSGPYLPIYGTSVSLLYIVSDFRIDLWLKVIIFAGITTGIEYITGLFFLKVYNTRLWDYTKLKFNFQGIIAPMYTVFWTILSMFFYYLLYPRFSRLTAFIDDHLEYSLLIGIFYGVFILDMIQSFNVLKRLRAMARNLGQTQLAINYDQLKDDISEMFDEFSERIDEFSERIEDMGKNVTTYLLKLRRPTFMRPFRGDFNMKRHLQDHFEKLRKRQ